MHAIAIVDEAQERAAWLERRSEGIGGSDAAVIHGASRWKSPFQLWAEKVGLAERSTEETEYQRWGRLLEPVVAQEYARLTGRKVIDLGRYSIQRHAALPFLLCTHDYLVEAPDKSGRAPLSIKTAAPWKADEWEAGEAPIEYEVQLQHEIDIASSTWGSFAVLIWGKGVQWFDVGRNQRFIDAHHDLCADFWRRVENGEAPEPDGSEQTTKTLGLLYPEHAEGKIVSLPDEALSWDREIESLGEEIEALEKRDTELRNRIRAAMGDAEFGTLPTGDTWTWKTQHRDGYVVKPTSFRVLRKKKRSEKGAKRK